MTDPIEERTYRLPRLYTLVVTSLVLLTLVVLVLWRAA
jgi:hypothetical protein